jgi:hypothetical protein
LRELFSSTTRYPLTRKSFFYSVSLVHEHLMEDAIDSLTDQLTMCCSVCILPYLSVPPERPPPAPSFILAFPREKSTKSSFSLSYTSMNHIIVGIAPQIGALGAIRHETDNGKSREWNAWNSLESRMHSMYSKNSTNSRAGRGLYKEGLMPE